MACFCDEIAIYQPAQTILQQGGEIMAIKTKEEYIESLQLAESFNLGEDV